MRSTSCSAIGSVEYRIDVETYLEERRLSRVHGVLYGSRTVYQEVLGFEGFPPGIVFVFSLIDVMM